MNGSSLTAVVLVALCAALDAQATPISYASSYAIIRPISSLEISDDATVTDPGTFAEAQSEVLNVMYGGLVVGSAIGEATVIDGALKAYAEVAPYIGADGGTFVDGIASADAQFTDTWTFMDPTQAAGAILTIPVVLDVSYGFVVENQYSPGDDPCSAYGIGASIQWGFISPYNRVGYFDSLCTNTSGLPDPPASSLQYFQFLNYFPATVTFSLEAYATGSSQWYALIDAANSFTPYVNVPDGVTFITDSQLSYLPQTEVQSVPEPGTLLLFAIGILGAAAARRHRRLST